MSPQPLKRQPFVFFFLFASLIWALLAWFSTRLYTTWQAEQAQETIEKRAKEGIHELEDGLSRTLRLLQYVTDLLSRYESIRETVDQENRHSAINQLPEEQRRLYYEKQPRLRLINEELAYAAKDADVISNIWIMKKDGITIASGNASDRESFVGTRFDYRNYFIDGISGKKGHQYAFGVRTGIPSLFFASPIRQDNHTIGVVASKVNLSYFYNWVSQTNGILIDKYGVIIQAGNHQFEMMSLPDATVHMLSEKHRMDRYNRTEFPVLSITPWEGIDKIQLMQIGDLSSPFYVMTAKIMGDEFTLMTAIDASSLLARTEHRLFLIILIGGGMLFFLVLTVVAYQFQILQRIRQRRAMAKQLINREISRADASGKQFAVMYIDMDAFKEVNDTFDYETGDNILQVINERIQEVIRKTDTIIRRTEDTFITLLNDIGSPSDVENIAIKIQEAIHAPLDVSGVTLRLTASIGIAMYPTDGQTASQILRHADTALYSIKEKGRAEYAFYHTQMSVDLAARNRL
ncbi:MAG: diguanylate cyclase, partial [Oxalobacter sp.]|nr:diguanylate cyclase [Oxalobacter sp.]